MVLSLWAMVNTVQSANSRRIVCWMSSSVSRSTADVASSRIKIFPLRRSARAKHTSCLSPTLKQIRYCLDWDTNGSGVVFWCLSDLAIINIQQRQWVQRPSWDRVNNLAFVKGARKGLHITFFSNDEVKEWTCCKENNGEIFNCFNYRLKCLGSFFKDDRGTGTLGLKLITATTKNCWRSSNSFKNLETMWIRIICAMW